MKICARKSSGAFWSDFDGLSGNSCVLLEEPKYRLGHVLISKRLTVEVVALDSGVADFPTLASPLTGTVLVQGTTPSPRY